MIKNTKSELQPKFHSNRSPRSREKSVAVAENVLYPKALPLALPEVYLFAGDGNGK